MDDRKLNADRQRIKDLGGPTAVARRLGYGKGGSQRVQNWMARGIPSQVKVDNPELFLLPLPDQQGSEAPPDAGIHATAPTEQMSRHAT